MHLKPDRVYPDVQKPLMLSVGMGSASSASQIRRINQRKIIRVMMRLRRASRAQLSKATGMSQATVGRIVEDLLGQSIIAEGAPQQEDGVRQATGAASEPAMLGRPSTPLELDRQRRRFLAVQLGVYQTRIAALPLAVSQTDVWPTEFETPASPDRWGKAVSAAFQKMGGARGVEVIVVSLPGVVDERNNRVLLSPNLRWTERADLIGMLKSLAPKAPVLFVQEIRALALGQLAAEPELDDFLLVDIGSGVGAAAIIGGKLYQGPLPLSGELGHTPVVGNRRPCGCGAVGCVETLVSKYGLLSTAKENGAAKTWEGVIERFANTVPDWMAPSLDAAAITIGGALNVLGLRNVVLTGNITELPAAAEYLCQAISRSTMWARFGETSCKSAPRRRMAGMVSAAIDRVLLADF